MASDQPDINKLRRRLLKAAAGAPVIFTLPVGTGVAAASIACNEKPGSLIEDNNIAATQQYFRPDPQHQPDSDGNLLRSESQQEEKDYFDADGRQITESCHTSLNLTASNLTLGNNRIV